MNNEICGGLLDLDRAALCAFREGDAVMADGILSRDTSIDFLAEFQNKLKFAEEEYRSVENKAEKINGLLKELTTFYAADRAFVIEIDWELGVGIPTFSYSIEGIDADLQIPRNIPAEKFHSIVKEIRGDRSVILDVAKMAQSDPELYSREIWHDMRYIFLVPFSNRINTGIIGIGNPVKYKENISFLQVLAYAIVAELNEIKLQERVDIANQHTAQITETDVYVTCLGGLELKSKNGILSDENITADQCYRLLVYLLCNHGKTKPVRELADIIWNDAPLNDPYRDLKNVVYRLKRFLSVIELDDFIIGSGGTFIINPKYELHIDFERFEEACISFFEETNRERRNSYFQKAKEIYKGSLLPRCDHIHWFIPRISYYQTLYMKLMKMYARQMLQDGEYLTVQKAALEGLEMEPYDVDFMVYQIISMHALGNHRLARSYYNRIEADLTDEQKTVIKSYWRQ